MPWTDVAGLRAQVRKLWDKGLLLAPLVPPMGAGAALANAAPFTPPGWPLRLKLNAPGSSDLGPRFAEVRQWAAELRQHAGPYRLQERTLRHREVGQQSLPEAVWLDTLEAATAWVGKTRDAQQFALLVAATHAAQPLLLPWLARRPLAALALAPVWPQLLAVVAWLQARPRPGIYLRQVDIAGVDSKFIESHRSVLTEWLDLALPAGAIDAGASGTGQFARRYGFRDKPLRVRFRWLDAAAAGLPLGTDNSITHSAFARLAPAVRRVFITENEVNFLAFPALPDSLVVFGAGYGFAAFAGADWLQHCAVHYWGDIDTHGFAILDQLRASLPHAQSLLMDEATLLTHRAHWGEEPSPLLRDLPRLTAAEAALFDRLRQHAWRPQLRLEQERIGFGWVQQALSALPLGPARSP